MREIQLGIDLEKWVNDNEAICVQLQRSALFREFSACAPVEADPDLLILGGAIYGYYAATHPEILSQQT